MKNTNTTPAPVENDAAIMQAAATASIITPHTFKSAALNNYTAQIAAARDDMVDNAKLIAQALGHVKSEQCYTDDGFKSVADYAEQTFGIKRSYAYMLATVGERFYNADKLPESVQSIVSEMPTSNLAKLSGLTDEQLDTAVKSGSITPATSQSDVESYARSHKLESVDNEAKVLKKYSITVYNPGSNGKALDGEYIENDIHSAVCKALGFDISKGEIDDSPLPVIRVEGKHKPNIYRHSLIQFGVDPDGYPVYRMAVYEYQQIVKVNTAPKVPAKSKTKFTREQLLAMLAEMDDAE